MVVVGGGISVDVMAFPLTMPVTTVDHLRGDQMQIAVPDPGFRDGGFGECPHFGGVALEQDHLQAVVMIKVNVEG